jgi:hypothetical protein
MTLYIIDAICCRDASLLWRLHWTPQDEPFLLESSSGEKFLLVPDADKSIRLVLDSSGWFGAEMTLDYNQ